MSMKTMLMTMMGSDRTMAHVARNFSAWYFCR